VVKECGLDHGGVQRKRLQWQLVLSQLHGSQGKLQTLAMLFDACGPPQGGKFICPGSVVLDAIKVQQEPAVAMSGLLVTRSTIFQVLCKFTNSTHQGGLLAHYV
jgi:hypothetical protein